MAPGRRRCVRRGTISALALVAASLAGFSVPASGSPPATAGPAAESSKNGTTVYIVQMADDPVVAYEGGRAGYAATAPRQGEHANPNSAHVRRYQDFLNRSHADALRAAGASEQREVLRLHVLVQRLRRTAHARAGRPARAAAERRVGEPGRAAPADDRQHADLPRAHRRRRPVGERRSAARSARTSSSASSTPASGRSTRASPTRPTSVTTRATPTPISRTARRRRTGTASARPASSSRRMTATTS